MSFLHLFAQINAVETLFVKRDFIFKGSVLFLKSSSDSIVDLTISYVCMIRKGGVKVVSVWSPLFDEDKRNICHCAVIDKVFKRKRPKEHTDPSYNLKNKPYSPKYGTAQEIEKNSVCGYESFIVGFCS